MFFIGIGVWNLLIAVFDAYKDPDWFTFVWIGTGLFWITLGTYRMWKKANLTTASN